MHPKKLCGLIGVALGIISCLSPGAFGDDQKYANPTYGFSFTVPQDMAIYTPERPGPFPFQERNLFVVANKRRPQEFIMVNLATVNSDKDFQELKDSLDSRGLNQPGYQKVAVQYLNLGQNQNVKAIEHIFTLAGQSPRTMRQIFFVHRGRGFFFTCTANAERFQEANQAFFHPLLQSLAFE